MKVKIMTRFVCLVAFVALASSSKLETYNVDSRQMSVSGLSAGGFMAVQMHVTYSKMFTGVGVIAGGPYWCAEANLFTATGACMATPSLINVGYLQQITRNTAATGYADDTSNMVDDKIFLFSGTEDSTVKPGVVEALEEYYDDFVDLANVKTEYSIASEHGFPTVLYGGPCNEQNKANYINKCEYDGAYQLLQHIYGDLQVPDYSSTSPLEGSVVQFDQTEFFPGSFGYNGLDDNGYIFIPHSCADGNTACKLHVAFHGCHQGSEDIGDTYVKETGYLEVAALNDIIVIFPQVKKNFSTNPNGCWDWWGYTGAPYGNYVQPYFDEDK